MITLILLLIFLGVGASMWFQGLWSCAVTLLNLLLAAMIAVNYFEPIAKQLSPSYAYIWDFLILWGLFAVSFGILRAVTDLISRHRVQFHTAIEIPGRSILAVWIAWTFVSFTCVTLHTAPLSRHFGGFQKTRDAGNFLGLSPGRTWLAFMQSRSQGALSRGDQTNASLSQYTEDQGKRVFDPQSQFIIKYYHRRANFEPLPAYRK